MSKTNLSVLIVEDEIPACNQLVKYVNETPRLVLEAFVHDGVEALKAIRKSQFDLILLDINLPQKNGMEVLKAIQTKEPKPIVIVTTAYSDYAVDSFELGVVDYLLKPFSIKRFEKAITRIFERIGMTKSEGVVAFKIAGQSHVLRISDIVYFTSKGKHTIVHTTTEELQVSKMLKDITVSLPEEKFFRVHKQHVVNVDFIERVQYYLSGRYTVFIRDEAKTIVPVGAKYAQDLKKAIGLVDKR